MSQRARTGSAFDFSAAMQRAWDDATASLTADGEVVETALEEAGAGLTAWAEVPPCDTPPEGDL